MKKEGNLKSIVQFFSIFAILLQKKESVAQLV